MPDDKDQIIHLSLLEGQARAILIDGTRLCAKAKHTHRLSKTATIALGRLLLGVSMMGDALKGERDSVTVTIKGSGPLGALVAVGKPGGIVKGYADKPYYDDEALDISEAVGREGTLTVIKDMGLKEPYIGQIMLVSGRVAEDLCAYYAVSEQTPSVVSLGVKLDENGAVRRAGGLIVQLMPGASEAARASVELSAESFLNISETLDSFGLEDTVTELFSHLQPVELERDYPEFKCDCSRERMERALVSFGADELNDMIKEQGGAETDCHFCNKKRRFSAEELRALIERIKE